MSLNVFKGDDWQLDKEDYERDKEAIRTRDRQQFEAGVEACAQWHRDQAAECEGGKGVGLDYIEQVNRTLWHRHYAIHLPAQVTPPAAQPASEPAVKEKP